MIFLEKKILEVKSYGLIRDGLIQNKEEKQFISMMTMVKLFYQRRKRGYQCWMFGKFHF